MSKNRIISMGAGANLNDIVNMTCQNLTAQGYQVQAQMLSPVNAIVTVGKDRDGFKNFMGLGVESKVNLTVMNNTQLSMTVDSEWTNKIIALAVGWFLCLIPFITGIIGCVNQSSLPDKIMDAFTGSAASMNQGGFQNFNNQPPYSGQ